MHPLLAALVMPADQLLQSEQLQQACRLAPRARLVCAISCVTSLAVVALVVSFYHLLPWPAVPLLVAFFFSEFICMAMLASRFGRLCDAQVGDSKRLAIEHLRKASMRCDGYYQKVMAEDRPFTRLDLSAMQKMLRK